MVGSSLGMAGSSLRMAGSSLRWAGTHLVYTIYQYPSRCSGTMFTRIRFLKWRKEAAVHLLEPF